MSRSKKCLKCVYCHLLTGSTYSKNWRDDYYCSYYTDKGHMDDKGPDPDNCLLFEGRKRGRPKRKKPQLKY